MANENTQPKAQSKTAPAKKANFLTKAGRFFKALPVKIASVFKNTWHELRKVTWPTRKELINNTVIVLIFMVFMGVVIGLLDTGASALIKRLIGA